MSDEIDRELRALDADLRRLEAEYTMFFSGRLPRPPWATRARVAATVTRLDRQHIGNYAERFRFTTLQSRYAAFIDLWDRGLRAREEGRPGPFARPPSGPPPGPVEEAPAPAAVRDRVVHVATFRDVALEQDKVQALYENLALARREAGEGAIPFDKFADLVRTRVTALREQGGAEVAFRVSMKDGKVALTARALKGMKGMPSAE